MSLPYDAGVGWTWPELLLLWLLDMPLIDPLLTLFHALAKRHRGVWRGRRTHPSLLCEFNGPLEPLDVDEMP